MESRIVASLDLTDEKSLIKIASLMGENVFAIKINWPTVLSLGKTIIGRLSKFSKVICDFKLADIPNTHRLIMEQIADQNPWAVIAHAFVGKDSLSELVSSGTRIISVVSMSNEGSNRHLNPRWKELMEDALESGVYGIVAPGNNYGLLRQISSRKGNMKVFSPGIGAQGGSYIESIENGSDYVIVGRTIYSDEDPLSKVLKINLDIENHKF